MDRRRFIKNAAGLFVAAAPAIIRPASAQFFPFPGPGRAGVGGGGLGLQTSCTAFWEFETTSWTDATGNGTTLSGVGSPTSVAGKVGNAASLGNSANALTASTNSNIEAGAASFSAAVWVNLPANVNSSTKMFNKNLDTFNNRDWGFGNVFSGSNSWNFSCWNTSSVESQAIGSAFSTGWHHLVGTYNSGTGGLVLYVDGTSSGTATLSGTMNASATATLNFGRDGAGTPTSQNPQLTDQAGFWKGRILSAGDVTALWNSGSGLSWAAML